MTTFADWFAQPARAAFGHAKYPNLGPLQRIQQLIEQTIEAPSGHLLVMVVASELERELLIKAMADAQKPECVAIHSYESLLRRLRAPNCPFWELSAVTFVCQVDHYFSAQFALGMMELMYAVRFENPRPMYRVLTMSESDAVDSHLKNAMRVICPGDPDFAVVTLPTVYDAAPPNVKAMTKPFCHTAIAGCLHTLQKRENAMIFCTTVMANEIIARLSSAPYIFFNEQADVEAIADRLISNNSATPTLIFMTGNDNIPIPLVRVSLILVEGVSEVSVWERGRIMRQSQPRSTQEVDHAISYHRQNMMGEGLAILIDPNNERGLCPRQRLDNDQSWGFMADIALHFRDLSLVELTFCFMEYGTVFTTVLGQFATMEFMTVWNNPSLRQFQVSEAARDMPVLLGLLGHNFHLAWLLVIGLNAPDASLAAKRAMIRIVALAKDKFRVISKMILMEQRQNSPVGASDLGRELAQKAEGHFSMPQHLYLQGIVWVSLAAWHVAHRLEPRIARAKQQGTVTWPEVPNLNLSTEHTRLVLRTVLLLNQAFNVEGDSAEPLLLTNVDCHAIQRVMVETWLFHTIAVRGDLSGTRPEDPNTEVYRYVHRDLVSGANGDMWQSAEEIMVLGEMMGTPGTDKNWVVFASLDVQLDEHDHRYYSDSVVLPLEMVAKWERDGEGFTEAVHCVTGCPNRGAAFPYAYNTQINR